MWIRTKPDNILEKESNIDNLNFLYEENNIYVMDNHLAAGWCWLQRLEPDAEYDFFHIDRHNDLLCNAPLEYYNFLSQNPRISLDNYTGLEFQSSGQMLKVFQWDNYIKQIHFLFPRWFNECYFSTHDLSVYDNNPEFTKRLNIKYVCSPLELYNNIAYWLCQSSKKWIFNFDLDYFFDDQGMQIFTDEYIRSVAHEINSSIDRIEVLTIALSPECCGDWKLSFRVFNIVAEELGIQLRL